MSPYDDIIKRGFLITQSYICIYALYCIFYTFENFKPLGINESVNRYDINICFDIDSQMTKYQQYAAKYLKKTHLITKLKWLSSRLAVVFAQSTEANCYV